MSAVCDSYINCDCSQVLRRKSTTIDFIIPAGWHRLVICEDEDEVGFDPWLAFLQGLAFAVICSAYDEGLLTFIASGPGEEWRLVDLGEASTDGWTPDEGWKEVDLNVDNMMEFMPRKIEESLMESLTWTGLQLVNKSLCLGMA